MSLIESFKVIQHFNYVKVLLWISLSKLKYHSERDRSRIPTRNNGQSGRRRVWGGPSSGSLHVWLLYNLAVLGARGNHGHTPRTSTGQHRNYRKRTGNIEWYGVMQDRDVGEGHDITWYSTHNIIYSVQIAQIVSSCMIPILMLHWLRLSNREEETVLCSIGVRICVCVRINVNSSV